MTMEKTEEEQEREEWELTESPGAIAESFVNGNISWTKKKLAGDPALALQVSEILRELYGEDNYKTFIKVMTR